jgi:hypothetical protein
MVNLRVLNVNRSSRNTRHVVDWIGLCACRLSYTTVQADEYSTTVLLSSHVQLSPLSHSLTHQNCTTEVNTEAIVKEKALLGAQLAGGPCVVEDTSLEFQALGTRTHACMHYTSVFDENVYCPLRRI